MPSAAAAAYVLRFVVAPSEYESLVKRLGARGQAVEKRVATCGDVEASARKTGDWLQKQVRGHSRLFAKTYIAVTVLNAALVARSTRTVPAGKFASAVTLIPVVYKLVDFGVGRAAAVVGSSRRFERLCARDAKESKTGTKTTARLLCQALALLRPFIAGATAGATGFSLLPSADGDVVALYVATKAVEYAYNWLDDEGFLEFKPRILGAWALFPFAFSQLFYTYVFHRATCPPTFVNIMDRLAGGYMPARPDGFPVDELWPSPAQVTGAVAAAAELRYPRFESPILYPKAKKLPAVLSAVGPVVDLAHPAMETLTGAILHPREPSEFRVWFETVLAKYGSVSKYVFLFYLLTGFLFRRGRSPQAVVGGAVASGLRTTTFAVMSAACAWAGVGLSQQVLNNKFLPAQRFRLIGFLAGLWAFADQVSGSARFLYAVRLAILSWYRTHVATKRGGRPLVAHGDVLLFAAGLGAIMAIFESAPTAVPGARIRKLLAWIRAGEGVDPVSPPPKKDI